MSNVCENKVYEAQKCASFYYLIPVFTTDKCAGRWRRGSTPKDELPEPRGS